MTDEELLLSISDGLKKTLTRSDIFSPEIRVNYLKRIDKIFNKGLHYYLDPKSPEISKDASVFFRKSKFGTELNFGARKIVNQFEDFKISLSAISKLAEIKSERTLPVFKITDNPENAVNKVRELLYPHFEEKPRDFLKAFISKLAENNILVFEFVEAWNKKEKANIDGLFLTPNVIVLKRQQSSFRREIFTLAHELGHYLLNKEEVEELDISNLSDHTLTDIEKWCNDFAFYFLSGKYSGAINKLDKATSVNDYHFETIKIVSDKTHLSQIAIFTRLLYNKKISQVSYNNIRADFDEQFRRKREEEIKQKESDKANGIQRKGSFPKPINSPLLISTIQTAFYEGLINEYDVCKTLNISPDKIDRYI